MAFNDLYYVGKRIVNWAVPTEEKMDGKKLEELVNKVILENNEVRDVLKKTKDDTYLRKQLEYSILDSYDENKNLRRFSKYIDIIDKPLGILSFNGNFDTIFCGVNSYMKPAAQLVEMSCKLPYIAYYAAKTKDFVGAIGNLIYEGLSFIPLMGLLDLTNRYAKQADKYTLKNAADKFLTRLGHKEAYDNNNKHIPDYQLNPI